MILIIQNGFVTPSITRYLFYDYHIVKSFENNVADMEIDKYSLIIILGGYQSLRQINNYPYLLNVVELIKKCIFQKKPIFGICLGCQLVAYALGCNIRSDGKLYIGYDTKIMNNQNVFRCHFDYIEPNDSIVVLEYFENMPYLYTHSDFIYGIQCHPDISPMDVYTYSGNIKANMFAIDNSDYINDTNKYIIDYIINKLLKKI